MDNFPDLEENTLLLRLKILDDDEIEVAYGHSLSEDFDEDKALYFIDLLNGLNLSLNTSMDHFSVIGRMLRDLQESEEEEEWVFEPDEELLEARANKKIIPFNKNKLN
jgi:hypothetical protein